MNNFKTKCKTKYSSLAKEYIYEYSKKGEYKSSEITINIKVNNKNINNFKSKVISSKNRNYNNLITIE